MKIEQTRNIYPHLRLHSARFGQTFAGHSPACEGWRSYGQFINLIQEVRRLLRVFACGSFIIVRPNIEDYRKYVDQFDISEEQKIELIHTVWSIMESFVDRAFGQDSVQICLGLQAEKDGRESANMLESDTPT